MAKTITFEMSAKEQKIMAQAAEILQRIASPAAPTVAVIAEAPAKPTKKAAVKKDATAKKAPAKKEAKKSAKKSKLITKRVDAHCRITLPCHYLNATGARFGRMDVLKKFDDANAIYYIPEGADFNRKHYKKVKTVNVTRFGIVNVGNLLKVKSGTSVKINLVGDKIVVRK